MHIFISYAKKDTRDLALKLREIFNSLPTVTAWMDESLQSGGSWAWQIQREINRCDLVVVLLSPDVNREESKEKVRSFVLNEIDYAQQEEVSKPIIPVMAQKTRMPVQLAGIQYIDLTGNLEVGLEELVEDVCEFAGIETPRQQQEREQAEEKARQKALDEEQKRLKAEADKLTEREQREQQEALVRQKAIDEEQKRLKEHTAEKKRRESREQAIKYEAYRAKTPLPVPSAKSSSQKFWFGGIGVVLLLLILGIVFLSDTPLLKREASNPSPTQIPPEFKTATKIIQNATATQAALTYTPPPLAPQFLTATTIIRGATETQAALLNPLLPNQLTATAFIQNATATQTALTYTPPPLAPQFLTATTIIRNATLAAQFSQPISLNSETATMVIQNATNQATLSSPNPREQAIQLAQAGVNSNDEWTPYSEVINGVEMVLVPAGCFMMGSSDTEIDYALQMYLESEGEAGQRELFADEQPQHQQCFDAPFWIDKYEVTRADYQDCAEAGVCQTKATNEYSSRIAQPVNHISWFEARDYCEWRGGRLPTEKEWEYAARGVDSLIFPWGNEFVADNVVYDGNSGRETANVGSRPGGASWVGTLDLSGNVWEWVSTVYNEPYPYLDDWEGNIATNKELVLRGGSFFNPIGHLRMASRLRVNSDSLFDNNGFRCARDFEG